LQSLKINAGYVDNKDLKKKIKMQLFQEYGDSLVMSYINQQVYLNDSVIAVKKLDKFQVERSCMNFLYALPEVSDVVCGEQLLLQPQEDILFKGLVQKGFNAKRSGDVLVSYKPAFMEFERTGTTHGSSFSYDTHVPLIFYGTGISTGSTLRPVDITDIASTICQLLNIPYTNGNIGNPIYEAIK